MSETEELQSGSHPDSYFDSTSDSIIAQPPTSNSELYNSANMASVTGIKGYLTASKSKHTRIGNTLKRILTMDPVPSNKWPYAREEFKKFVKVYEELDELYKELLALGGTDANIDTYFDSHDQITEMYFTMMPTLDNSDNTPGDRKKDKPPTPKLRIPDMKPFDNTVRKYPSFKSNFRMNYEKFYGNHAAMVPFPSVIKLSKGKV